MVNINRFMDNYESDYDERWENFSHLNELETLEESISYNMWSPIKKVKWKIVSLFEMGEISKKILIEKWYTEEDFNQINNEFQKLVKPYLKRTWNWIKNLRKLTMEICDKIDNCLWKKQIIEENRHQIKSEIALRIYPNKIIEFIELLKKIENLWQWSPDGIINNASLTEKNRWEFKLLMKWFRANIRTYSEKNEKWKNDWNKIIEKIREKWEHKIADWFIIRKR